MSRYDIALGKIPVKPVKVPALTPEVNKIKSDAYLAEIFYRGTLNSLLHPGKRYEIGEVVMLGSEPIGICIDPGQDGGHFVYCHGTNSVLSTNRVDSMRYAKGDKLFSINGLLTGKIPDDDATVVGVVIEIRDENILVIQMRI
jgi:hypothetical protein